MTSLFMDTSALVKRYAPEKGSNRVKQLVAEKENEIYLSRITLPEVTASLAAKARAPQGISSRLRDEAWSAFLGHCEKMFILHTATKPIINRAVEIAQRRKIRGCDAIQLATALMINAALIAEALPPLVFVAADGELLQAASEEGLVTENPEEQEK